MTDSRDRADYLQECEELVEMLREAIDDIEYGDWIAWCPIIDAMTEALTRLDRRRPERMRLLLEIDQRCRQIINAEDDQLHRDENRRERAADFIESMRSFETLPICGNRLTDEDIVQACLAWMGKSGPWRKEAQDTWVWLASWMERIGLHGAKGKAVKAKTLSRDWTDYKKGEPLKRGR